MADRHGPLRTLMGRFVERMNDGRISDGAVVVSAADLGVDDVPLGMLPGRPTADGSLVSVVVPAGARAIKIASPPIEKLMLLVPGEAISDGPITLSDGEVGVDRLVGPRDLLPGQEWRIGSSGESGSPGSSWLTPRAHEKIEISVEKVERVHPMAISVGDEGFSGAFGVDNAELSGEPPGDGDTVDPERFLLAVTGGSILRHSGEDSPGMTWPDSIDFSDAVPVPAPMGGVTFGVAVLSTPSPNVAGQQINPLSRSDIEELLQREEAKQLLTQAGVTDLGSLTWVDGPERADPAEGPSTATLLGSDVEIQSYVAIVEGEAGPWGIGAHFVRTDYEGDHVIVVGVHRRMVGSAPGTMEALLEGDDIVRARELTADTADQLETI